MFMEYYIFSYICIVNTLNDNEVLSELAKKKID